jgi:hypothetical protein
MKFLPGFYYLILFSNSKLMKKILLPLILLFSITAYSQHEADNWFFGSFAGLNFFNGTATPISGSAMDTNEGCATISDNNGNLLFYTDGITVWNRNNQVMANGTGLMGGLSSTQSSICIPLPGSTTIYYVFTVDEIGGPNGFRYSIVDMTLDGGNGDVDVNNKNIAVLTPVTEKLTAMRQSANEYRIAVHEWGTDAFFVYHLTAAGLQPFPVVSNVGSVHNFSAIQNTYGNMKFSPCGDKIAAAIGYQDTVEIFDFDANTGIVSNAISLPIGYHVYGIEYSRTGDLLYVSCYDPLATLIQFDITSGNAATILASKVILSDVPDIYGLQIANDGRIYVNKSHSPFVGVINFPNVAGIGCNYVDMGVNIDTTGMGVNSGLNFPAFIQSAFRLEVDCTPSGMNEASGENLFTISPNPVKEMFEINLPKKDGALFIYDALGKNIYEKKFSADEMRVELSLEKLGLHSGIYFSKVAVGENVVVKKFVCAE